MQKNSEQPLACNLGEMIDRNVQVAVEILNHYRDIPGPGAFGHPLTSAMSTFEQSLRTCISEKLRALLVRPREQSNCSPQPICSTAHMIQGLSVASQLV